MIKLEHTVDINRPVEEVFSFITNHENDAQWRAGLVESKRTSEGPVGVGSTGTDVLQFLGRRIESSYELTEFEENRKLGFKTTSGPIPMEGGYTMESAGGGTKVAFTIQGDSGGFFRLAEPILARMVKRQVVSDFGNLKDLLEAQG